MAVKLSGKLAGGLADAAKRIQERATVHIGVLDSNVAGYATAVEYGWAKRVTPKMSKWFTRQGVPVRVGTALVNPPRPFLRGTMAAEAEKWKRVAANDLKLTGGDLRHAAGMVGTVAVDDVRETIRKGSTRLQRFPRRSPLTMALYDAMLRGKKKPSGKNVNDRANIRTTKPLEFSGALSHSIAFEVK